MSSISMLYDLQKHMQQLKKCLLDKDTHKFFVHLFPCPDMTVFPIYPSIPISVSQNNNKNTRESRKKGEKCVHTS